MTISLLDFSSGVYGSTSATLTYSPAPSKGRLAVAFVGSGHPTAGLSLPSTPDGWELVGTFEGGGGTYGVDTGPRRVSLFIRELQGDDEQPTFTVPAGTDSVVGGTIYTFEVDPGQPVYRYQASFGADTSSGTSFSVTGAPALAVNSANEELVVIVYILNTDTPTASAEAIAVTGITFGTITERQDSGTTTGADLRRVIATGAVSSGTATGVPTITATLSGAATGVAGVIKIADFAADAGPASISASYDATLSRVRLSAIGFDPNATLVDVARSVNQIQWTPVRGGTAMPVASLPVVVDTFTRTVVDGWGTSDTGQTATLSGGAAGDYDVGSGVGTIALPDTNSRIVTYDGVSVVDVEASMTATFPQTATGGSYENDVIVRRQNGSNYYYLAANADTAGTVDINIVKVVAGVLTTVATISDAFAYSPGNRIGLRIRVQGARLLGKVWNDSTGTEPAAWTIGAVDTDLTAAGTVGIRSKRSGPNTNVGLIPAFDNFTASELGVKLDDYEFTPNVLNYYRITGYNAGLVVSDIETTSLTPTLTEMWLKSVARPFLNLTVATPLGETFGWQRSARGAAFPIVGRSLPIAVTDVRGPRQYPLKVRTDTADDSDNLDLLLASGDVLFLHVPAGSVIPAGGNFVAAGQVSVEYPNPPDLMRFTTIMLTEVAAPGPDVVGATSTWQTVLNNYASWSDLIAAKASWSALLEIVADASEVIVP